MQNVIQVRCPIICKIIMYFCRRTVLCFTLNNPASLPYELGIGKMRRLQYIIFLFLTIVALSACVSKNRVPKEIVTDSFLMDIKDDGTKLFIYIANFRGSKPKPKPMGVRIQNNQPLPSRSASAVRSDQAERQERLAIRAVDFILRQNRYCRAGYLILNSYVEFGTVEIRAECQESATESDRAVFL